MQFGTVFLGLWRGEAVAVKCIIIPSSVNRHLKTENMAVGCLNRPRYGRVGFFYQSTDASRLVRVWRWVGLPHSLGGGGGVGGGASFLNSWSDNGVIMVLSVVNPQCPAGTVAHM